MAVKAPELKEIEKLAMVPVSEFSSMFIDHTLVMLMSQKKYGSWYSQKWRIFAEVHVKKNKFDEPCSIKHLIEKYPKLEVYSLETCYFFPNFFYGDSLPCLIYHQGIPDPSSKYEKGRI